MPANDLTRALLELETAADGRIGLSAIDTANGKRINYRADERFPMCSTFKTMAVAAILDKSMRDPALRDKHLALKQKDLFKSGYAPITEKHVDQGMSVAELCAAAMQYSDNAAINRLMKELGGPAAVTNYVRSLGDKVFRLDRWEPELNTALPGDARDTSTPAAMARTLQKLTLGEALAPPQRAQLVAWLQGNTTGDQRMRAGVPDNWVVGDKTGTGAYGTTNDIGILWPPNSAPIVAAIFFTRHHEKAAARDDVIASVTQLLIHASQHAIRHGVH
jgi:beta-lactamase class A